MITWQGVVDGIYYWRVAFAILVNYENTSPRAYLEPYRIDLILRRVSTLDKPRGIAIEVFQAFKGAAT